MKPRSDAKLLNLPEEHQAKLCDWLLSGLPYHRVKEMVAKEFGVDTSLRALSLFYQQVCSPALLARRRQAVSTADEIASDMSKQPGRFDESTIEMLRQKAFELSIQPMADPRDVKAIFSLVLKARDQDLEARRIAVLEAKAAKADEAEKVTADPALTPEERARRYKEIFGLAQ